MPGRHERTENDVVVPGHQLDAFRRSLLPYQGRVFVAFNTTTLPLVIQHQKKCDQDSSGDAIAIPSEDDKNCYESSRMPGIHWATNRFPFSGWAPAHPVLSGPLLGRLYAPQNKSPVEQYGIFFGLNKKIFNEWESLESGLLTFIRILMQILPEPPDAWPLERKNPDLRAALDTRLQISRLKKTHNRHYFKLGTASFL